MPRDLTQRLPPPLCAVVLALLTWVASRWFAPAWPASNVMTCVALVLAIAGTALDVGAKRLFVRLHTTVNPMTPDATAVIVHRGPYRWTRNPMYIARLSQLAALALYLGSAIGLLGVALFAFYLHRWRVPAEERALAARFPVEYGAYRASVRRWI